MKKLLVMGYARHGKDTVAEIIQRRFGASFMSSSLYCAEHVIYPALCDAWADAVLNGKEDPAIPFYKTPEEAFEDRGNHRAFWFKAICDYRKDDEARLGREIFAQHDVYCGIRSMEEYLAVKNARLYDHVIWVHRKGYPVEDPTSCTVGGWLIEDWIHNDGNLDDLEDNTVHLLVNKFGMEPIS